LLPEEEVGSANGGIAVAIGGDVDGGAEALLPELKVHRVYRAIAIRIAIGVGDGLA